MTAEEWMRERAAQVCRELGAQGHPVRHHTCHDCADAIRALPLEGEQGEPAKDQRDTEELDRLRAENAALREKLADGVVVPREQVEWLARQLYGVHSERDRYTAMEAIQMAKNALAAAKEKQHV